MTYNDFAQIVLQSLLATIGESVAYAEISRVADSLGLDVDIHVNVTVTRSAASDSAVSADAKFLQDMHIAPDLVPVAALQEVPPEPPPLEKNFSGELFIKIAKIFGCHLRKGNKS
jgi:hypothetical protein